MEGNWGGGGGGGEDKAFLLLLQFLSALQSCPWVSEDGLDTATNLLTNIISKLEISQLHFQPNFELCGFWGVRIPSQEHTRLKSVAHKIIKMSEQNYFQDSITYLKENQGTEACHPSLQRPVQHAFIPKVSSRNENGQTSQSTPHAVCILHVEDPLEFCQWHTLVGATAGANITSGWQLWLYTYLLYLLYTISISIFLLSCSEWAKFIFYSFIWMSIRTSKASKRQLSFILPTVWLYKLYIWHEMWLVKE